MCKAIEDMLKQEREEGRQEGFKIGFEIGVKVCRKLIALRMLSTGEYTLEEISKIVDLPIDELQKLQTDKSVIK